MASPEEIMELERRFWQSMQDMDVDTAVSLLDEYSMSTSGRIGSSAASTSSYGVTIRNRRSADADGAITLGARPPLIPPMLHCVGPSTVSTGSAIARTCCNASSSFSIADSPRCG